MKNAKTGKYNHENQANVTNFQTSVNLDTSDGIIPVKRTLGPSGFSALAGLDVRLLNYEKKNNLITSSTREEVNTYRKVRRIKQND